MKNKILILGTSTVLTVLIVSLALLWYMDRNKCRAVETEVRFPDGTVQVIKTNADVRCLDDLNKSMTSYSFNYVQTALAQGRDKLILCINGGRVTGVFPYETTDITSLNCEQVSLVFKDKFCDNFDSPICRN